MKTFTSMAGSLGVLLLVLAVLGLGISTVSAAAGTSSSGNLATLHSQGSGHHFAQNSTRQHAFLGTNTTAAAAWFAAHPGAKGQFGNMTPEKNGQGFAINATARQARLQSFITQLQNKGVDVSAVQTALANNDTATVKSWITSYMEAHKGTSGNTTHMQSGQGFTVNATARQAHLQSFITQLQNKGVDVSALQTAIQNNDTAAEKTWLTTYAEAHKGQSSNTTRQQWHPWNATVSKSA
jgi:DNA-binding transcriptional MerR regulator